MERYPLYSHADEALYLLGQCYEGEVTVLRSKAFNETAKARAIESNIKNATDAYSKILTRYPVMDRAEDAKKRLEALHRPIPTPTPAAIAQNKAEEESRQTTGMMSHMLRGFQKHPDVARATKIGEPALVDPKGMSATEVVNNVTRAMLGAPAGGGEKSIAIEVPKDGSGAPPPNEPAPRSDNPVPAPAAGDNAAVPPPAPADSQ